MQALDHLIHDLNLIPLYNEYKHDGMAGTKTLPAGEFASYIMQSYQTRDDWDRENFLGAFFESRTAALFRPPFVHTGAQFLPLGSDIPIHFYALKFGDCYNRIDFDCSLSARHHVDNTRTARYADPLMQLYTQIARILIEMLRPDYLWISEYDEYSQFISARDVLSRSVASLYWANYFAPGYLTPAVEKFFLTAPVGHSERLAGGVWYQLHPRFEAVDDDDVEYIEQQVIAHFTPLNITDDTVQWKFMLP